MTEAPVEPEGDGLSPSSDTTPSLWPASTNSDTWIPIPTSPLATPPKLDPALPGNHPTPSPAIGAPRRDGQATLWRFILGLDIAVVLLLFLASAAVALAHLAHRDLPGLQEASKEAFAPRTLWVQALFIVVTMGLVPLACLVRTRVGGWQGAKAYLNLKTPSRAVPAGVLVGLPLVGLLLVVGFVLERTGQLPDNGSTQALTNAVTLPLAIALSIASGFGEETFFRGVLQKRIGVLGQALLFAFFHIDYGTLWQVLVPLVLGLFFGILVRRGRSLWLVIAAHTTFNLTQFVLVLAAKGH